MLFSLTSSSPDPHTSAEPAAGRLGQAEHPILEALHLERGLSPTPTEGRKAAGVPLAIAGGSWTTIGCYFDQGVSLIILNLGGVLVLCRRM